MANMVTINNKALQKIIKSLKGPLPVARVGILGDRNSRTQTKDAKETATNPEIGAAHEFGTSKMERRSFLRMPLIEKLNEYLDKAGAFSDTTFKEIVATGSITSFMKKVGTLSERIVMDAFASNGFGKWPKWKSKGYTNNTGQILVDTQQLRNSITNEVV